MSKPETKRIFDQARQGDQQAAAEIFDRYVERLAALARARLSPRLRQKVDAEDIVQSVFRSFFLRARGGQFRIKRSGELWSLLVSITRNKVLKQAEHYRQQKRNINRDEALAGTAGGMVEQSDEPTAAEALALADEVEFLMKDISPVQRHMLELRLQCRPIAEIAETVERSERTVRRFLVQFRHGLEIRLAELRDS